MRPADEDLPRIALFSAFPPEGTQGGAAILRDLFGDYPADRLLWISRVGGACSWRADVLRAVCPWRVRGMSLVGPTIGSILERAEGRILAPWLLRQAHAFRADVLWIILDHDVVEIALRVMGGWHSHVHVSVHDDPEAVWAMSRSLTSKRAIRLLPIWARADSADAVSQPLVRKLRDRGVRRVAQVTRGFAGDVPPGSDSASTPRIVMGGFIGEDPRSADLLLQAFRLFCASVPHARPELHLFDTRLSPDEANRVFVHEWLPPEQYESLLRSARIGFAYDPIDLESRQFASTSFPTKLVTYVGFGKPFVYRGPSTGSVGELLKRFGAGVIVDSDSPIELAEAFRHMCFEGHDHAMREAISARRECFSLEVIRKETFELVKR